MKKKKKIVILILTMIIISVITAGIIIQSYYQNINVQFNVQSDKKNHIQLFYGKKTSDFKEQNSLRYNVPKKNENVLIDAALNYKNTSYIRIDFDEDSTTKNIISDYNYYKEKNHQKAMATLLENITAHNCKVQVQGERLIIEASGSDPYIVIKLDRTLMKTIMNGNKKYLTTMILFAIMILNGAILTSFNILKRNKFFLDLLENKKLIWRLSKNDFKTKYAGSFFGIFWAFVQPVVTIVLYWFVFQVGLRSGNVGDTPFVLWLMCGLVPWFFFQDAIMAVTNSLIEYNYLVKKVVFKIDILPLVKVLSSLFVHIFFIIFSLFVFSVMGYLPTITAVQLFYYLFCMITFVLALGYATCALILFFKDIGQIIQIFLQIGMWMTPIMWNVQMIPKQFLWLIELNPMYYIVAGYRDSLIDHVWFWNRMDLTINFWLITIALFIFGTHIYKKLRYHFADVL